VRNSVNLRNLFLFAVLCLSLNATAAKPNILVILLDDLGYSDLGCYGGEIRTPNMDALAKGGVRFEGIYNSARCCPSRASLMTGLYPPQAGIADFVKGKGKEGASPAYLGRLNNQCVTMAEVLKPAGYATYYVGKWHLHHETGPIKRGFDEYFGYTKGHSHDQWKPDGYRRLPVGRKKEIDLPAGQFYATDVFNEYALEFLRKGKATGKPWFLFLSHSSPHFPLHAPAKSVDKYYKIYQKGWDVLRKKRFAKMKKIGLVNNKSWTLNERAIVPVDRDDIANNYSGKQNPAWDSLSKDRQNDLARRMAVFAAMVDHVDRGVGKITAYLKKTGQLENTLILLTSDNGACYEWGPFGFDKKTRKGITVLHKGDELLNMGGPGTHMSYGSAWASLGNTPFKLYKHFTHEGGVFSPFIVHWPGGFKKKNVWIRERTHLMDIMPTVRVAAGAKYPKKFNGNSIQPEEGVDLLPAIKGKSIPERTIYFSHQGARAVIRGGWKIVWGKRMPWKIKWELYDLNKDRSEARDLAKKYPERVKEMVTAWDRYAERVGLHPVKSN